MTKIRIHELAKELGVASGDLLQRLKDDGFDVNTASSSIEEGVAQQYRAKLGRGGASAPAAAKAAGKPKAGKATPQKKGGLAAAKSSGPAAPALPPPQPIERRPKAVKPQRPGELTASQTEAMEERRRVRAARLRGEIQPVAPAAAVEAPEVPAAEPATAEPVAIESESASEVHEDAAAPVASAETAEAAPVQEPVAEETGGEAEAEEPATVEAAATATAGAEASGQPSSDPGPPTLQLPRLVAAPPRRDEPAAAAAATSAGGGAPGLQLPRVVRQMPPPAPPTSQPPMLPQRGVREFRGPIRKIELPQTSRPALSRGPGLTTPSSTRTATGTTATPAPGQGVTRTFSTKPGTGLGKSKRRRQEQAPAPVAPVVAVKKGEGRSLRLTEGVTVKELADKMDVKAKDIIRLLMSRGIMVTVNVALEPELAKTLASDFGFAPEVVSFEEDLRAEEEEAIFDTEDFEGEEEARPPVVTVMGHVDHGKTSLLDAIRKTDVAAGEAGGITQSIGAYQVDLGGRKITFIDTPGHEAFTSMRARGAQVTDVVVLVIAATDSVMPQTIEAINHAKAAGVPVIVAVNKIDLPNARVERVKTDLMTHGIVAEEFGGDVVCAPVSARTRAGVDQLLELILLTADMRSLKASVKRRAQGTVLEAGIDRGMGPFANIIVQDGTLKAGDAVIVGAEYGRVRALLDDRGGRIEAAGPSTPVRVTGLQGVPNAGDRLQVIESEARAREISEFRMHKRRDAELAKSGARGTLLDLSRALAEGETKELAIVIKADVHGAVEVLSKTLQDLSTAKVKTKIIHAGTGAITDSDVLLASASRAVIVGFNVRPERGAAELAEREKVIIRPHAIIYELIQEMKKLMAGLLDAVREEEFLGRAEVRQTFKVSRVGMVAGCSVQDGKLTRTAEVRLVRDGAIIWTGRLGTLKRFKDDAREVLAGFECGLSLDGFNDIKVGDVIEAFQIKETRPDSID